MYIYKNHEADIYIFFTITVQGDFLVRTFSSNSIAA